MESISNPQHRRSSDADLEIRVKVFRENGVQRLIYVLQSAVLGYESFLIRGDEIRKAPDGYQAELLGALEKSASSALDQIGALLYRDLFPKRLKDVYRDIRSDQRIRTISILSDEHWIPWELMKPSDQEAGYDDDFIGCRFELSRWMMSAEPPSEAVGSGCVACIDGGGVKNGHEESRVFEDLAVGRPAGVQVRKISNASYSDVKEILRDGDNGVVHFVGHGMFEARDPDSSRFGLIDHPWRPRDLIDPAIELSLRRDRPLIFLNSCRGARLGWTPTRLGGWASRWILGGCGAFIAPQWSVDDDSACKYAESFYMAIEQGETIAQATMTARLEVRREYPESSDWLAYTVYTHPKGKIRFESIPTRIYCQCEKQLLRLREERFIALAEEIDQGSIDPRGGRKNGSQKILDLVSQRGADGWSDLQDAILAAQPLSLAPSSTDEDWVCYPRTSWRPDGDEWVALGMSAAWMGNAPVEVLREAAFLSWKGMSFGNARLEAQVWSPMFGSHCGFGVALRYIEGRHAVLALLRGDVGSCFEIWHYEGNELKLLAGGRLAEHQAQRRLWVEVAGDRVWAGVDDGEPIQAHLNVNIKGGFPALIRFGSGVVRFKDPYLKVACRPCGAAV